MTRHRARRLALVATAAALVVVASRELSLAPLLAGFLERVRGLGALGPVLLAAAYVPATVLFVPGSILTLGAGFAFGVVAGTAAVSVGSTAGAAVAFWVGRTLARDAVEAKVRTSPRFAAIDRAVGEEGFKVVLLTRLSPVFPFNLLNYAFGLTKVSFRDYVLASWVGMLPGTLLYVYLGSAVGSLAELAAGEIGEGGVARRALFLVGLAATAAVTALVTRAARRALEETAPDVAEPHGGKETVHA